jgi:hypothetical protein
MACRGLEDRKNSSFFVYLWRAGNLGDGIRKGVSGGEIHAITRDVPCRRRYQLPFLLFREVDDAR